MKINLFIKGVIGLAFSALIAKAGDCDKISTFVEENNIDKNISELCEENDQGKVVDL